MPGVSIGSIGNPPASAPAADVAEIVEAAREAVPSTPPAEDIAQPAEDDAQARSVPKIRRTGK